MLLSAVIIARNEEQMIENCIKSLLFCDEIVLIDNGSTDKTVQIVKKYGANVYEYKTDDFSKARNFGKDVAKGEWVVYVDADERVSKDLARSIREAIKQDNDIAAFRVKRKNYYLGNHPWPQIEYLERFFRKSQLKKWHGRLHESADVDGKIGLLDGYLFHLTHRNLSEMLSKTIEWSKVEAKLRFEAKHPKVVWWRFPRVMFTAFFASYVTQKGYKAGTAGVVESIYQAFSMFVTYARLWEMQNEERIKKSQ